MKKNLTKKLMLSVLTLAFAVVSLGASTFAWFTLSGQVKAGTFEASVIGGYGLDVTVSEVGATIDNSYTWYTGNLPSNVIEAVIGNDAKFLPTSPQSTTIAKDTVFKDLSSQTIGNSGYIAFDLHFRMTDPTAVNKDAYLKLDSLKLTSSNKDEWTADIAYGTDNGDVEAGDPLQYDILSSARVAFVYGDAFKAYEQEKVSGTAASNTEGYKENGAVEYYNKKMNYVDAEGNVIDAEKALDIADAKAYETTKLTNFVLSEKLPIFTFEQYALDTDGETVIGTSDDTFTLTVFVWVEGWDAECLNAIFNQGLAVDMSFAIYDSEGNAL